MKTPTGRTDRFLQVEMIAAPPMTAELSGLRVEYAIALIYSSEAGRREATIAFDVGEGTQDLGFRAEVPVLFEVRPAVAVKLRVLDHDGTPTTGRFMFLDRRAACIRRSRSGSRPTSFSRSRSIAPTANRAAAARRVHDVLRPRAGVSLAAARSTIPRPGSPDRAAIEVKLERWINPADYGYYSGDHHIHAAGCAHYTSPTEGVRRSTCSSRSKARASTSAAC